MYTNDEIIKCLDFAYKVTDRTFSYYKDRNTKASKEKMIQDCFIGKLAELQVYYTLRTKRYAVTYPDFDLGFNSDKYVDLVVNNKNKINIHVKCCRYDSFIKDSWLIETKEIEQLKDNDYFALCEFQSLNCIVIKKIICASDVAFSDPVHNLPTKKAIYLKDLK